MSTVKEKENKINLTTTSALMNQATLTEAGITENDKQKIKKLSRAWQNEADLEYESQSLERNLLNGIRELKVALESLKEGRIGSLNGSGILQSTNSEIDRGVTKVKCFVANRSFYKEFSKVL